MLGGSPRMVTSHGWWSRKQRGFALLQQEIHILINYRAWPVDHFVRPWDKVTGHFPCVKEMDARLNVSGIVTSSPDSANDKRLKDPNNLPSRRCSKRNIVEALQ